MMDKINKLTVNLDMMNVEDTKRLVSAISLLKGVLNVQGHATDEITESDKKRYFYKSPGHEPIPLFPDPVYLNSSVWRDPDAAKGMRFVCRPDPTGFLSWLKKARKRKENANKTEDEV